MDEKTIWPPKTEGLSLNQLKDQKCIAEHYLEHLKEVIEEKKTLAMELNRDKGKRAKALLEAFYGSVPPELRKLAEDFAQRPIDYSDDDLAGNPNIHPFDDEPDGRFR